MAAKKDARRSARHVAARVVNAACDGEVKAADLLQSLLQQHALPEADARLAAELSFGLLRTRLTCEHLAARFSDRGLDRLPPSARIIIALGVYQLCWLDHVPDFAAVDETVSQAGRLGPRYAGLTNAILRRLVQARGPIIPRPDTPDPRRFLPIDAERGRCFDQPVFPDPARRPLDYLIAATSHTPWLVERWHRRFKPAACAQICWEGTRRPELVLRPNRLRTDADTLIQLLAQSGRQATRLPETDAIVVQASGPLEDLSVFRDGLCQPQDATAQLPLLSADPKPGQIVLDFCAGRGTKSTQAAELMRDQGLVIAHDPHAEQLEQLAASARRLGLNIVQPASPATLPAIVSNLPRPPDLLLLDVPCSNTGVLSRRPEARYRAGTRHLASLVELQRAIIEDAVRYAGPATRLLYSTCSLEQEENSEQVVWLTERHPHWLVQDQSLTRPGNYRDGGYFAILEPSRR